MHFVIYLYYMQPLCVLCSNFYGTLILKYASDSDCYVHLCALFSHYTSCGVRYFVSVKGIKFNELMFVVHDHVMTNVGI